MHGLRGAPEVSLDRLSVTLVRTPSSSGQTGALAVTRAVALNALRGRGLGHVSRVRASGNTVHLGSGSLVGVSAPFISPLHVNGRRELVLLQESVQRGAFCSCCLLGFCAQADLLLLLVLHLFVLFPAPCSSPSIPRTVRWDFQTCPGISPGRNGRASVLQRNWRESL